MVKKIIIGFAISIAVIYALLTITYRPIQAQPEPVEQDISAKLEEISKGQKDIIDQLKTIKEELGVIKIRVTQNQ